MRTLQICALILIVASPVFAEPVASTGLSMPTPRITEYTLIQGSGWSDGFSQNESLACDIAQERAKRHLAKGLAYARNKGFVSPEELMHALLQPAKRTWQNGRCVIRLEVAVPVLTKTSIPLVRDRRY
jgi:hypothetical protein